jgi:hypothetical protein
MPWRDDFLLKLRENDHDQWPEASISRSDTFSRKGIQLGMVRGAAVCQKFEPLPRLILRILNRARIAPWFKVSNLLSSGMNQYLD